MLRFATISAIAVLVSSPVSAGDWLIGPVPPAGEPKQAWTAHDWSGFYAGLQIGGASGEVDADFATFAGATGNATYDVDGLMIGRQSGYRWQSGPLVLGAQTDMFWAPIGGSDGGEDGTTETLDVFFLATATGRVGVAVDRFQPYVLAGLAYTGYDYKLADPAGASVTHDEWDIGGTVGFGTEFAITEDISVFGEVRHYWFGERAITSPGPGTAPDQTVTPDLDFNTATVGFNWRF